MSDEINTAVNWLSARIGRPDDSGGLSTGDLAALRRMEAPLPPAFWRLLSQQSVQQALPKLSFRNDPSDTEQAFAIVMQIMAEIGGQGSVPVGRALARSGYAEARFVKFLRARGNADVAREAGAVARWCAGKGDKPMMADAGRRRNGIAAFVLYAALRSDEEAERRAHAIARDYYASPSDQTADSAGSGDTDQ